MLWKSFPRVWRRTGLTGKNSIIDGRGDAMKHFAGILFAAAVMCASGGLEETIDFSGIDDLEVGDARSTMRHAACASGFFIASGGYFVTDRQQTKGAERLVVVCGNKAHEAEPVPLPDSCQFALLKVKGSAFTPVVFAQGEGGKAGDRLLLTGFAASDENGIIPQLSWGVVSGKKRASEYELYVSALPEQVGALVANDKGQFEGMLLGTGRKTQTVCRVLKRREIDTALPIEIRRRFVYSSKTPILNFDQLGQTMANCTGLVLIYDEKRRVKDMQEKGREGKPVASKGKELSIADLEKLTPKSKEKKTYLAGSGSGFFITADGYFITNHHVIDGAEEVAVLYSNKTYMASVVAKSKDKDLALLKMDGTFCPVRVAGTNQCRVGQSVFLAGYPKPEYQGLEVKVTKGIISSLSGFVGRCDLYQVDAAIQSGNSGGPAGDENGNAVGVAVATLRGAQLVTYIIKWCVVDAFLPKGVKASLVQGKEMKGVGFMDAVQAVVCGTGQVLAFAKGTGGVSLASAKPDEREKIMRGVRRALLCARSAKLDEDWKTVDEVTVSVLNVDPENAEAKELHDMAQEKLGRHLIVRAVVESRDVKARIRPVCGFRQSHAYCDEPLELHDKSKKREFPVIARLTYDEEGRHYEGTLETVYDWSGTKEITVELKLSTD